MRKDAFCPCNCKKSYFCKTGHTGVVRGVDTKKRKLMFHYQCGGRLVSDGCTMERINLNVGTQYCRKCYRLQDAAIPSQQREKNCNSSRLGCVQCQEPICKSCWKRDTTNTKKIKK